MELWDIKLNKDAIIPYRCGDETCEVCYFDFHYCGGCTDTFYNEKDVRSISRFKLCTQCLKE